MTAFTKDSKEERMRFAKLAAVLLAVTLVASACSLLGPTEEPPATGTSGMNAADGDLRTDVISAMTQAAQDLNVSIQAEKTVYLSRADLSIAHALVTGFDTLTLREPDRIAVLGLAYISLPQGAQVIQATGQRTGIPDGFYLVQIRTLEARVHLIDTFRQAAGTAAAILPLEKAQTRSSSEPQIMATGCRVELRYVQGQVHQGRPAIQSAVPLDWCPTGL